MRRLLAGMVAALLLTVGCNTAVEKQDYLLSIITLCAHLNNRLEGTQPSKAPGRYASELRGLVDEARDMQAPEQNRNVLRRLLNSFSATADRFAGAAEARQRGDEGVATAEVDAANERLAETSTIAQEYGMPPLSECAEHTESPPPAAASPASPAPSGPPASEASDGAAEWRTLGEADLRRQQVAVAEVGGLIYVAGGIRNRTGTRQVMALDPTVDAWRHVPDLPIRVHHAMAVNYRDELVVLGGWMPRGNNVNAVTSDRVFVLRFGEWDELGRLNRPRAAGAAAVVDDRIVVIGGQADDGLVAETEIYDGDADEWHDAEPVPTPREHLAAAADDRYVYAVGGRDLTPDNNVDVLERYDPAANAWDPLKPMPTARGSIGAGVIDQRLVVVGGETSTGVLDTVEAYDIPSGTWSRFPSLHTPRHGAGVATLGSSVYAINGAEGPGHTRSSTVVEALHPPTRHRMPARWRELPDAPLTRQQVGVAEVNGVIWVAGGLEEVDVATAAVRGFDPTVKQWRSARDLPVPLHHAMAVNYRDELVVLGGWVARGSDPTAEESARVFVLRGDAWDELASLHHARAAGAAAVVDDRIVVVGGQADRRLVPQTEVYDGDADRWSDAVDIPTPREHLAAAAYDHQVYVVGGRKLRPDRNLDVLERYDPAAKRWATLTPMPTARGSIGGAVIQDWLAVVGGETSDSVLETVELYDFAADRWVSTPGPPTPRHGPGVAARGWVLYVLHGAETTGHENSSAAVEALNFR